MVVSIPDETTVIQVVQENEGKHSDRVIKEVMKRLGCGPVKAGNLLRYCVTNGKLRIEGFSVYTGGEKR